MNKRFHLIIDAQNCNNKLLGSQSFIEELIRGISRLIDMRILKGPVTADGIEENPGLSCFTIIDFSHISIHTFTKTNEFCLDIFSCKSFDYKRLYEHIKDCFGLKDEDISGGIIEYAKLERIK
jgi:S-adenosylmethionine/arginine decarboxylase-like enzyme